MARLRRAAKRQIEREDGASGRIGRGFDLASMRLDDRFDQTQAEAETPLRAAFIAAEKSDPKFAAIHRAVCRYPCLGQSQPLVHLFETLRSPRFHRRRCT